MLRQLSRLIYSLQIANASDLERFVEPGFLPTNSLKRFQRFNQAIFVGRGELAGRAIEHFAEVTDALE